MGRKADRRIKIRRTADGKRTDRVRKAERERMLRLRNQGKTIEEIALELDRSERTVSKQLQKAQTEKEQTDGSSQASQKEIGPLVLEAQKKHLSNLHTVIEEWQCSLFIPLPREVSREYRHPVSEVKEQRLFERLREHISNPMLWVYHWLWDYYFGGYKGRCEDLIDTIRREWFATVQEDTTAELILWAKTNKHHYYMPIYLRLEQWAEERKKGMGLTEKRRPHEYRVERKKVNKLSDKRGIYSVYVDDILVGECYDSEKAIELYARFSDKIINDDDTDGLIFCYLILEDLTEIIREQLNNILERRPYINNICRDCPTYEGEGTGFPIRPDWATDSLYDRELKRHFDDLVAVGSVIWSRLETILRFKAKYTAYDLTGNVVDGASWSTDDYKLFMFTHTEDMMKISALKRLDTLLAECLMHHFGHSADFNAEWTDWRQVTFENIGQETVDKLYLMLARKDIEFCNGCPVCHGLKTVFDR